jgi:anti-sigma regulatory factor (Ser/Thr protein kinase)
MEIERELPASPAAASLARQVLDGWLTDLVGPETADNARLAASELVENAVRHAGLADSDTIRLSGVASDDIVRIEVEQRTSAAGARLVHVDERGELDGGFGLRIVDEIANQWGVRADAPGAVWFEVDRDGPRPRQLDDR